MPFTRHLLAALAEYAEKKDARERLMQRRDAWRLFLKNFGHAKDKEFFHIFTSVCRFAQYDDPQAEILRRSMQPLSFEHEIYGDFVGPMTENIPRTPGEALALVRLTLVRWCDWIDAVVHYLTHMTSHLSPVLLDPNPENRELASLGVNQRFFAQLSDFGKNWWHWHHGEAAERFKDSGKWQIVGKAMAATTTRNWSYPELDEVIIVFWPLLTWHNWTYRDLLRAVREVVPRPDAYPCRNEQEFATYCVNVLGLRKKGQGQTAKNTKPGGFEVAMRLCGR